MSTNHNAAAELLERLEVPVQKRQLDPDEVVVYFGAAANGGPDPRCSELLFRGVRFLSNSIVGTYARPSGDYFCNDSLVQHGFVVAVSRSAIPRGEVTVTLGRVDSQDEPVESDAPDLTVVADFQGDPSASSTGSDR